jgi:ribonuclease BN (tRNA processing enzyme)
VKIFILGAGVGGSHYLSGKTLNQYPPAFLIEWGKGNKLLFDCSQGVQNRLEKMGFDYASVHHVAISHPHPDHCAPIHFIQSVFLKGLWGGEQFINKELFLYGPDYLIENIPTLWNIYVADRQGAYLDWPHLHLVPVSKGIKTYQVFDAILSSQKVYHAFGRCDAVAYRLETPEGVIAYSGDTGECEGIRRICQNADLFVCEASGRVGDAKIAKEYGHLDPFTIGDIAKSSKVKKLILFHYTGQDSDEAMIQEIRRAGFLGEIIVGKDFQEVSL